MEGQGAVRTGAARGRELDSMMRAVVYVLTLLVLACETTSSTSPRSQSQPGIAFSGEVGSSLEQAVLISGALNRSSVVSAESSWLAQRYPGYKRRSQTVITVGQRTYEQLEIETADGQPLTVYFDVTVFFSDRK